MNFIFNYAAEADGNTHGYMGTFKIISGTSFTPALQNRSSTDFRVLAFDVEQLVRTYWSLVNSRLFGRYINSLTQPAVDGFFLSPKWDISGPKPGQNSIYSLFVKIGERSKKKFASVV